MPDHESQDTWAGTGTGHWDLQQVGEILYTLYIHMHAHMYMYMYEYLVEVYIWRIGGFVFKIKPAKSVHVIRYLSNGVPSE